MTMEDQFEPNDSLSLATAALREAAIPDGPPAGVLAQAQKDWRGRTGFKFAVLLSAASIAIIFMGLAIYLVVWRSESVIFADVVQTIGQTHTFTGKLSVPVPDAGVKFALNVAVKGSSIRIESAAFIAIIDQSTNNALALMPLVHQAIATKMGPNPKYFDIYQAVHDYQSGTEKPLGEKIINGQKVQGFQVSRSFSSTGDAAQTWTFWVNPESKLPIQIEVLDPNFPGPFSLMEIHFDVPLNDVLFETKVPRGYTLLANNSGNDDPWKRHKYAGQVFDERGNPISGVEVSTSRLMGIDSAHYSNIASPVETDADGRFTIDAGDTSRSSAISVDMLGGVHVEHGRDFSDMPIRLEFRHPDFVYARLEDMNLMPSEQRSNLRIRMVDGKSINGRVIDASGHPVIGAMVAAIYGRPEDHDVRSNYRKVVASGDNGKFTLQGLLSDEVLIQVRTTDLASTILWGQKKIDAAESIGLVEIPAKPLVLPAGSVSHNLFGMKLVDVDDDLRSRLSLSDWEKVLVVDPGAEITRWGLVIRCRETASGLSMGCASRTLVTCCSI